MYYINSLHSDSQDRISYEGKGCGILFISGIRSNVYCLLGFDAETPSCLV